MILCKEVIKFIEQDTTWFSYEGAKDAFRFEVIENNFNRYIDVPGSGLKSELNFIELVVYYKKENEVLFNLLKKYHPEYLI